MIDWILDLFDGIVDDRIVVVHPSAEDEVRSHLGAKANLAFQRERTGMLDAILEPSPLVADDCTGVWIIWCDQVAMSRRTIEAVAERAQQEPAAAAVVATLERDDPYIHFDRNAEGAIVAVRQAREGDPMPSRGESDMGLFRLSRDGYLQWLPRFADEVVAARETGERNFLPFFPWLLGRADTASVSGHHDIEALGVNTPEDRARVERYLTHD